MTEPVHDPVAAPGPGDDKTLAVVVYAIYLAGLLSAGALAVVGLVLAYVAKRDAPEWLVSHYVFQIRTFWLSLLFAVIGFVTLAIGVGVLILVAIGVWIAVRSIIGLALLLKGQPYPTPRNWML